MLLALCFALGAEAADPQRVLILHSFGRDFAPYDTITSVFRTELARRSAEPVVFAEASLDFSRATSEREERALAEYLRSRFSEASPNVVVTIGPPTDAVVAGRLNLPSLVDNVLQLLPETETIAVVIGASELERYWRDELKREFAQFAGRVNFEWLDDLSLAQMQERVARLPPHSAVLYVLLIVDAAGIPHERQDALASLHGVANAPIFGLYENELGKGVVGGPYSSQRTRGEHIATAALRALGGPAGSQPRVDVVGFEVPIYDWRELQRWNIDTARLPPGSEIRFKPPSIWEAHRVAMIATTTALALQAALIAALLLQRARRRRAERETQHLGGRILTAQEDERRRLARERGIV